MKFLLPFAFSLVLNILLHRSSILEVSRSFFFCRLDRSLLPRNAVRSYLECEVFFPSTSPPLPILPVLYICILASSKLEFHAPFSFCLPRQIGEHHINFDACNSISANSLSILESFLTTSNLHFQNTHLLSSTIFVPCRSRQSCPALAVQRLFSSPTSTASQTLPLAKHMHAQAAGRCKIVFLPNRDLGGCSRAIAKVSKACQIRLPKRFGEIVAWSRMRIARKAFMFFHFRAVVLGGLL